MDLGKLSQRRRRGAERAVCPFVWPVEPEQYERPLLKHSGAPLALALFLAMAAFLYQYLSTGSEKRLQNREHLLVQVIEQKIKIPRKPEPPPPLPPRKVVVKEPEPEEPVEEEPMEVAEKFGVDESAVVNGGEGIKVPLGNTLMTEPVYGLRDVARPPEFIRPLRPRYTEEARGAGVEGLVKLELVVDSRGRLREVSVIKSLGYGLDESAMAAVRQARFKPALYKGNPVACRLIIPIRFVLE
jgi:TonB family protein